MNNRLGAGLILIGMAFSFGDVRAEDKSHAWHVTTLHCLDKFDDKAVGFEGYLPIIDCLENAVLRRYKRMKPSEQTKGVAFKKLLNEHRKEFFELTDLIDDGHKACFCGTQVAGFIYNQYIKDLHHILAVMDGLPRNSQPEEE
ncbi:MAG: hypothetical protein HQL51_14545 [Magnetococcales bacterium]|nr:hypothetical protein [Magnetococcales bacterium]